MPNNDPLDDELSSSEDAGDMDDLILGFSGLGDTNSLDELSQAYAQLLAEQEVLNIDIASGLKPSAVDAAASAAVLASRVHPGQSQGTDHSNPTTADSYVDLRRMVEAARVGESEDRVAVTPNRILESLLFVGAADNTPLSGRLLASLMRGVSPEEVESMVDALNKSYESEGAAYRINREALGFRMELAPSHASLRQRFYGQIREAKLPQPVIDVLALVAYHQPVTRKQVEQLIGNACGAALNQLLRRKLIELAKEPSVGAVYRTTSRFLELFELGSLDDLPQSESVDTNS